MKDVDLTIPNDVEDRFQLIRAFIKIVYELYRILQTSKYLLSVNTINTIQYFVLSSFESKGKRLDIAKSYSGFTNNSYKVSLGGMIMI